MANTLYSGRTGAIKIGEKVIAHMNSFDLTLSTEIAEAISFGNIWKEKVPTILDWSATADGSADFSTTSGQGDLMTAFLDGQEVTLHLALNDTTYFEGMAFIESLDVSSTADGLAEVSVSFAGSNAVVLTSPSA